MNRCAIALRALEPRDLDLLYNVENDSDLWQFSSCRAPLSRHDLEVYINNYDRDPLRAGQIRLMAFRKNNDETIGIFDLYDIDPRCRTAMVAALILPQYRGKGYALQALNQMRIYAVNVLGLRHLGAEISCNNTAARKLFEKAGYTMCGTLSGWWHEKGEIYSDLLIYTL